MRTYNTIINACNRSGQAGAALKVYQRMLTDGAQPTATTYTALISAYGKTGQVWTSCLCLPQVLSLKHLNLIFATMLTPTPTHHAQKNPCPRLEWDIMMEMQPLHACDASSSPLFTAWISLPKGRPQPLLQTDHLAFTLPPIGSVTIRSCTCGC